MKQTDLFSQSPPAADDRYTWEQVQGVTNNFHHALLDMGERTRYWVRYRIKPSDRPWFVVTARGGVYPVDFASLKEAQDMAVSLMAGKHRA